MTEHKKRGRPSPELDRIKRDLAPRFLCDAADHSLIWKRCLQNTVTSDPLVPSGGGDVIGCYLDFSSPENDPFRTMAHLTALTGYKGEKVRKIVAALVACGYMVRTGTEPSGAVTYRLANPRGSAVLDYVASEIILARNDDAAKKRVKRSRAEANVPSKNEGDKSVIVPSKTGRDVPSKSEGDVPSKLGVQYKEDTLNNTGGSALWAETAVMDDLFEYGFSVGPDEKPIIETRVLEGHDLSEFGDPPAFEVIPEEATVFAPEGATVALIDSAPTGLTINSASHANAILIGGPGGILTGKILASNDDVVVELGETGVSELAEFLHHCGVSDDAALRIMKIGKAGKLTVGAVRIVVREASEHVA